MGQLPRAGDGQDGELYQGPSNNLAVGAFTLVAEFGFSFLWAQNRGFSQLLCQGGGDGVGVPRYGASSSFSSFASSSGITG